MDKRITGTLENWAEFPVGSMLYGDIYGDVRHRWPDGTAIRTSLIDWVDLSTLKEGDIVQTRNSTYKLGKKYNG